MRPLVSVHVQVTHRFSGRILSAVTATTPGPLVGNQQHVSKVLADALRTAADTVMLGVLNDNFVSGNQYDTELSVHTQVSGNVY